MKINDIIGSQIDEALRLNNKRLERDIASGNTNPNPLMPRVAPPQDVYDHEIGMASPVARFSPGRIRPMWDQPDIAITHTPVNSLLMSGQTQSTQLAQIVGGVVSGVRAPATGLVPIPNMQVVIPARGPIHVIASITIQSTDPSDVVSFAFFHDGEQRGQIFTHTTPSVANTPTIVNLSMIDAGEESHFGQNVVYSIYWKAGSGTLSAVGTQRSMYVMNLIPQ